MVEVWGGTYKVETYQTFTSLALVDPPFTTAEYYVLEFLMSACCIWVTLWTAFI